MLRIGICDDNIAARLQLRSLLEQTFYAQQTEYQIYEFSSGEGVLHWFEKHEAELDLLFLDIEMNGLDGMETARQIRRHSAEILLVFVTGYSDYVFEGYEVGALDYLMKPVQPDKLGKVLTRVFSHLYTSANQFYLCRNQDGVYRIPRRDILYFASNRRLVLCVTATREYQFYSKLDAVQVELDDPSFVRIHQRYLVRAGAVSFIGENEVSIEDIRLPVSRSYKKDAILALTRAMLEG
jgi:DNA-binding LytR/AlgR family response regulator